MRILAAPDKMRGTLDAVSFASAIARAGRALGHDVTEAPMSDGGEGFAACFGGHEHFVAVTGPLGEVVRASFFLGDGFLASLESAAGAGRALLPHPTGEQVVLATTRGVGELIVAAGRAGATRVLVGCGGTATTDGGRGAVAAIEDAGGLGATALVAATDVMTRFVDAADRFGPQKGATPPQVELLGRRLFSDAAFYEETFGVDVTALDRAGAAGGLAGGLAALGAELRSGFDLVAEHRGLARIAAATQLVVTGEGSLDATTLEGKTISSLLGMLSPWCPVLLVCGTVDAAALSALRAGRPGPVLCCDLSERFGERSLTDTEHLVEESVREALASRSLG